MREAKLSSSKKIIVRFFQGAKTKDLIFRLIPNLKNNLNNISIHIGTNDMPYKNELKDILIYLKEKKGLLFLIITFSNLIYKGMVLILIVTGLLC